MQNFLTESFRASMREAAVKKTPTEIELRRVNKQIDHLEGTKHSIDFATPDPKGHPTPSHMTDQEFKTHLSDGYARASAGVLSDLAESKEAGFDVGAIESAFAAKDFKGAKKAVNAMIADLRAKRKELEDKVKTESGIAKRQKKEQSEAAKPIPKANAARSTHSGTCQFCGKLQKLPNGTLSLHGYAVRWSSFQGVCGGSNKRPYEETCDDVKQALGYWEQRAKATAAVLASAVKPDQVKGTKEERKKYDEINMNAKESAMYVAALKDRVAKWKPGTIVPHA